MTNCTINNINQHKQLDNKDYTVILDDNAEPNSLSDLQNCYQGTSTGDNPRYTLHHWEIDEIKENYQLLESVPKSTNFFAGKSMVISWGDVKTHPIQLLEG